MINKNIDNLDEVIMAKFLMGECSEDELYRLNLWLKESGEHAHEFFKMEELYFLGKSDGQTEEGKVEKAEQALFDRLKQEENSYKHKLFFRWMRYAAIFAGVFILLGASYYIYQTQKEEKALVVVSTLNEVRKVQLPDGTTVWLNKHTVLKYPRQFSGKKRNVYMDGEAYFEVKRDIEKPFTVKSEVMQVRVLGTVFNLKSEKTNKSAVATLIKGEIEVKGNHNEGMVVLSPGQKAELNGMAQRLVVKQVDTGTENWYSNEFVFEKADIYTIARTLEKSYGVKIILSPDIDMKKTYSGTLAKKEDVESVLKSIENTIPIKYKIVGSSVFISLRK